MFLVSHVVLTRNLIMRHGPLPSDPNVSRQEVCPFVDTTEGNAVAEFRTYICYGSADASGLTNAPTPPERRKGKTENLKGEIHLTLLVILHPSSMFKIASLAQSDLDYTQALHARGRRTQQTRHRVHGERITGLRAIGAYHCGRARRMPT